MSKIKKLFAIGFCFWVLVIGPIIAETVAGIGSDEIIQDNTALVIDSLHTQEPPGELPGEIWVASYYAGAFHGRKTASGEIFDKNALTCAHKTLPFQTLLKVTNPKSGKSVIVRVNDRGPFHRGRDLDLSFAAAQELGMIAPGVIKVEVQILPETQISQEEIENQRG